MERTEVLKFIAGENYSVHTYNGIFPSLRKHFTELDGRTEQGEKCFLCNMTFTYVMIAIF